MHSAGSKATIVSHGPQMANGGKAGSKATTVSHGPQMANGGPKLGQIFKNPNQTALQQQWAENKRKYRAEKREAEAKRARGAGAP